MPPETVKQLLAAATSRLRAAGCDTPDLDARLLLQAATRLSREEMILEPERKVGDELQRHFLSLIARRETREPVSRILGQREFYGRPFVVTPATLDPRADTETLVDAALDVMPAAARILDLGTGTGAIAVTLLAERPEATGVATDLSAEALAVARQNAEAYSVAKRLTLLQGSWLEPVTGLFDVIAANPPYIPASDVAGLAPDVRNFDPVLALIGGYDGLDPYRIIAFGAAGHLAAGGHVLVEIGATQADDVAGIFTAAGFRIAGRHRDLGGHVRCLAFMV